MKRSELNAWLAALRSNEYKQGIGKMCYQDKEFCCLGVLRKVTGDKRTKKEKNHHEGEYRLTDTEKRRFKMNIYGETVTKEINSPIALSSLNDIEEMSFKQIADIIESNPLIYIKKIDEDVA